MRGASAIVALAGVFAGLLSCATARAADEALPVTLEYNATPACPSRADFFEEMRARAPRVRPALPSERAYGVRLRIAKNGSAAGSGGATLTGEVDLVDLDGHEAIRRLGGSSCLDVARALALVVALDVAGIASLPTPRTEEVPRDGTPLVGPDVARPPGRAPSTAQANEPARWLPSVSLHGGLRSGVAPEVVPSATLSFALDRDASRHASEFRVSASYASGDTPGAHASVVLRLAAMALDACVPRVDLLGARVRVMPCARLETGVQVGELQPGLGPKAALWVAPGLVGRLRAAVAGNLFVEAEISGLFPLLRTRFFEGDASVPVFASPWLAAGAALGAGMSFP